MKGGKRRSIGGTLMSGLQRKTGCGQRKGPTATSPLPEASPSEPPTRVDVWAGERPSQAVAPPAAPPRAAAETRVTMGLFANLEV
jgi:hypothetical protein